MADSVFPAIGAWWLSRGSRRANGVYVPANSSASPTDTSAQPRGAGKYTIDLTYTSGVNVMAISIVWYDAAGKRQAVSRMPDLINIPAGKQAPLRIDVELPPSQWAKWVPVLEIPAKDGHDILIHDAKIYPTPPPTPETSVFTWPGQWWTNTGKQSGTDLAVPPGGIFVPWATQATPVKSGNWEVVFTYTAASPSRVSVAHNKFKEADETKQTGQSRIGDFDLPAGSNAVKAVRFTIPTAPDPLWTPQFQLPAGVAEVTFHKIEVHEYTPEPDPSAISVRSHASAEGVAGSVPALSAESRAGDLAVIFYASQFGNTAAVPPAGWTRYLVPNVNGRSGYTAVLRVTDPSQTQNVRVTGPTSGGARERALLIVLSGVKDFAVHPWQAAAPTLSGKAPALVASQAHGNNATPLADWRPAGSGWASGGASTQASWSALLSDIVTSLPGGASALGWTWLDLEPDPNAPAPNAATIEVHGEGSARVWVHEAPQDVPAQMRVMPPGYPSIDGMVAQRGFLVAHRGGSASWPEMSMRAYTNSVAHGAGALEVSTHRTSDGVWVLAHDQNLKRVDPSAPSTPIAQMTWAEVQRYRTSGERILRVEEYLEVYGSSHVTVLDPKYSADQWADLARLLPEDAKSRVIWKSAGDATWLAAQWKASGWRCWGYAYAQHADDGSLDKWAASWDYLGFPWDATPAQWSKALSLGKPVWAHICPSKAAYDQGISRGAAGCMVSGVADVLPYRVV
nr:MAG TPA: hypothetical protein [Caudoviricetes sp.]